MGHKNDYHSDNSQTSLKASVIDIIIAAIAFYALAHGLKSLMDIGVPGLFKDQALKEVLISGGIFLAFWAIVGNFFIRPFIELVVEREERTLGDEKRAQERLRQSRELKEKIEAELGHARLDGIQARDKLILEAKLKSQSIIEESQRNADTEFTKEKGLIEQKLLSAKSELPVEASKLSQEVITRLLTPGSQQAIH